jgi:DNA repair exonuclease SbcCD nuclease subunit
MSIVFFGDLHLDEFRQFSTILSNGLNSRLVEQMKVVGQIANLLTKEDTVIYLGDLINSYGETLKKILYSAAFYTLKAWAQKCKHLYVLIGNHDRYRHLSIIHAFDEIDNVTIVPNFRSEIIDGYGVDMVSWLSSIPEKKGDILAAHLMPIGAHLGALFRARAEEGVPIQQFEGYKYIILGHCHEPQELPVPHSQTVVQCIGSIMQLNLASSPVPRYLYRLDKDKWSRTEIAAPKLYTVMITTQTEADDFFKTKKEGYHKVICTDHTINFPQLDHTVVVEYDAKPQAGKQEIDESKDIDLLEVIYDFIDASDAKVDKEAVKEHIAKLY